MDRQLRGNEGPQSGQPGGAAAGGEFGHDLQKVANELAKLHILLPDGTQVTADHVEQHIGISKDYNI